MLLNKNKALKLIQKLNKSIKKPRTSLKYRNQFTLLISVVLSAQCTDVNVNNVTKDIYKKYYRPEHFVKLGEKKIRNLIKRIGLFNNKAKYFDVEDAARFQLQQTTNPTVRKNIKANMDLFRESMDLYRIEIMNPNCKKVWLVPYKTNQDFNFFRLC
jgi:endonuclease III